MLPAQTEFFLSRLGLSESQVASLTGDVSGLNFDDLADVVRNRLTQDWERATARTLLDRLTAEDDPERSELADRSVAEVVDRLAGRRQSEARRLDELQKRLEEEAQTARQTLHRRQVELTLRHRLSELGFADRQQQAFDFLRYRLEQGTVRLEWDETAGRPVPQTPDGQPLPAGDTGLPATVDDWILSVAGFLKPTPSAAPVVPLAPPPTARQAHHPWRRRPFHQEPLGPRSV